MYEPKKPLAKKKEKTVLSESRKDILYPSIIIFTILVLIFSVSPFSPIYRYNFEPDEICYQVMSRGLLSGKLPYRDLFDHKGPLTYFIYALGLLISGKATWGIWLLFSIVDAASFFVIYKTFRFFYDPDRSFVGVQVLICLLFAQCQSIFMSGTKPEHVVLLLVLLSEYLMCKRIKNMDKEHTEKLFSCPDMLIQGLLCGAVFMIKLNFCIYYLIFIGLYFLFQLYKKQFLLFIRQALSFLSGILLICLPIFGYYYVRGGLSDLIDIYFVFNATYAKADGYKLFYFRPWITIEVRVAMTMLLLFGVLAYLYYRKIHEKDGAYKKQLLVYFLGGIVIVAFLTLPLIYTYALGTLVPLLMWGPCMIADFSSSVFAKKKVMITASSVYAFIVVGFLIQQLVLYPAIPRQKTAFEKKMDEYAAVHPDATYMYFSDICDMFFYDLTTATPDFKYFYVPNGVRVEIIKEQSQSIIDRVPDVLAFYRAPGMDDQYMEDLEVSFQRHGYVCYTYDYDEKKVSSNYYIYIKEEDYARMTAS